MKMKIWGEIASLLLVFYSLTLCFLMFFGFGKIRRITYPDYMYNLKPFATIGHFLQFDRFNAEIWIINIFGNIGVFVPLGILIPLVTRKSMYKSYIFFLCGLFILESLQLLTRRGSFDIDDLLLNSVGFFIGYGLYGVRFLVKSRVKGECLLLQRYIRSDQGQLEEFMQTMYDSRGYVFDPEGLHSDIRRIEQLYFETGGGFWLLKEEQSVIGTIGLKGIDSENRIGEIKRFFVLPEHQDKGYGKSMMRQTIQFARQAGFIKLKLDTEKQSYKALSVFRRFGFYEIPKYNDNEIAEIFMELSIVSYRGYL